MKAVDRMKAPAMPHKHTFRRTDGISISGRCPVLESRYLTRLRTSSLRKSRRATGSGRLRFAGTNRSPTWRSPSCTDSRWSTSNRKRRFAESSCRRLPPGTEIPPYDTLTHGLALTPDERELYVTSMAGKAVYAFSVPELKQLAKIDVGRFPNWITINPDGRLVWVSNQLDDTVSAIDTRSKKVVTTIPVGHEPSDCSRSMSTRPSNGRSLTAQPESKHDE